MVLKPLLSGIKRICVKDDRMVSKTGTHILLEWLVRQPGIRNIVSDKIAISVLYRCRFHRKMDWKNPKSINEKFLWLTVFDRNPLYSILVDKYEAKQWMAKKLEQGRYSLEHIIPLIYIIILSQSILTNFLILLC